MNLDRRSLSVHLVGGPWQTTVARRLCCSCRHPAGQLRLLASQRRWQPSTAGYPPMPGCLQAALSIAASIVMRALFVARLLSTPR